MSYCSLLILLIPVISCAQAPYKPIKHLNANQILNPPRDYNGGSKNVTPENKGNTSLGTRIVSNRTFTSFLRTHTHTNHPGGAELFPDDQKLSQLLDNFLNTIQQEPYFLPFFSKFHLLILNELYQYLMEIYVTFNLNRIMPQDAKKLGKKVADQRVTIDYLNNEQTKALNKKTMIINHLITVIEAQANGAITARFPGLPKAGASNTGKRILPHEYGADLDLWLDKMEEKLFSDPKIINHFKQQRENHFTAFGTYLALFKEYTQSVSQPDSKYGTVFAKHALKIQNIINPMHLKIDPKTPVKQQVKLLRSTKTVNPPIFFYNDEVMRTLRVMPTLAKLIPQNSTQIGWPETIIQDAVSGSVPKDKNGNPLSNQPIALFKDKNGQTTYDKSAAHDLFVNIPTINRAKGAMFTQKMRKQPEWLNSEKGVILMLRACLGDYTVLFDPLLINEPILDPCIMCILSTMSKKAQLIPETTTDTFCSNCQSYIKEIRDYIEGAPSENNDPGAPPGIPQGPPGQPSLGPDGPGAPMEPGTPGSF